MKHICVTLMSRLVRLRSSSNNSAQPSLCVDFVNFERLCSHSLFDGFGARRFVLHRKEVIQPHLPIRLPCYDFTPVANPTFGSALLAVELLTSGITGSHGVTGGVYKARERIHRGMLIRDY